MLGNLTATARVFERMLVYSNHRTIYYFKPCKHAIKIRSFHSTITRPFANSSSDSPTGNNSPLKPAIDNNKNNVSTPNTAKETPPATAAQEETESNQLSEESQHPPSDNNATEHVAEYILRSPTRRKRSTTRSRSRVSKSSNSYKPVIPQIFLKENYLPIKNNKHSFASMSYPLEDGIRDEILYSARANLFSVPKGNGIPARRGHILLNCPIEGASYYLDSIVKSVASSLHADLLTFDRQDLMELTANMFSKKGNVTPWPLFPELKGFNPYIAASPYSTTSSFSPEDEIEDDVFMDEESFESSSSRSSGYENKTLADNFQYNSSQSNGSLRAEMKVILDKIDRFFETLVSTSFSDNTNSSKNTSLTPKIIYFRDVGDLVPTTFGTALINSLVEAVQNQRYLGDQMMIIAGYSPSLFAMEKKSSLNSPSSPSSCVPSHEIQWVSVDIFPNPAMLAAFTHIAIPPPSSPVLAQHLQTMIAEDKNVAIRHINVRTLKAVCASKGAYFKVNDIKELGCLLAKLDGLDNEVWGFERVHRLVMNAIGISLERQDLSSLNDQIYLEVEHFILASNTLRANQKLRKDFVESASSNSDVTNKAPEKLVSIVGIGDGKIISNRKHMRKEDLDKYEKKLLGCVVDPGFSDIHVAQTTVQTLQTLITLPLMRPQSFSYGVLRRHFISGVLLFGPPGTGKTMLAKAVAKESGSTVIEIKSSDVYDMYVGEGEKNVRAIFSLARKLSPCVIFLDELDAIFGSRRSDIHNGAHREIINQFMAEWDGLTSRNEGVLIMGATNRPFDLDDAILRRMPRRILVDLPTEKDREQILHLHLRDEKLDPSVSLTNLAKITNLYSGSDLKNLCISAALAAVREDAEKEQGNSSTIGKGVIKKTFDKHPEIRVLKTHHFQLALKQVTPSCSEDMSSLTELRKWDTMYGDGAWNRKRRSKGIGFDVDAGLPDSSSQFGGVSP